MKCLICNRPDAKEIDRLLLSKAGLRSGVISSLAAKLDVDRTVLWRHRKFHLGMTMKRRGPKGEPTTLEEKAAALSAEAKRLQQMAESGMEKQEFERALRALNVRVRLLQVEGQLAGRLSGGKTAEVTPQNVHLALKQANAEPVEEDPEELERARKEFLEVCGPEADLNA